MNPIAKRWLYAYGAFCVANAAVGYFWVRTLPAGQTNALADLNTKLLPWNILARVVESFGPNVLPPAPAQFLPAPAAVVTDTAGGTTTYFGP